MLFTKSLNRKGICYTQRITTASPPPKKGGGGGVLRKSLDKNEKNHPDGTVRLSAVEWEELHFVTRFLFVVKIKEQPKRGSFISCDYIYFVAFRLLSFFSFCCSE
jgi:hypothetical protein